MKILLNVNTPFMLAHGGGQIQIEQTKAALEKIGVEVENLRWWDDTQACDVLHFFGRMPLPLLQLARARGIKVVLADLLTEQGSRTPGRIKLQKIMSQVLKRALPASLVAAFNWEPYRLADACIANTVLEKHLMQYLFSAPPEKVHVVPNGVEEVFFDSPPLKRGPWLVCTATITPRKRVLELAEAAVRAQTPLWVIGKAYAASDDYARRFMELSRQHPGMVRYEGAITDRAKLAAIYRAARGFVLLSSQETRSLSSEEAAACECPLLLSDLPWARSVFQDQAVYCPVVKSPAKIVPSLRNFYEKAPALPPPSRPKSWVEVARQFQAVYEQVLTTP